MASELDFEMMDQYLANKLSTAERIAFEQKLEGDPELNQEYQFQKQIVEGIRQARVAELKAMLNNIPVSTLPGNQAAVAGKVVAWIVAVGIMGGLIYYFTKEKPVAETSSVKTEQVVPAQQDIQSTAVPEQTPDVQQDKPEQEDNTLPENETPVREDAPARRNEITQTPAPVSEPVIDVFDPTAELNSQEESNGPVIEQELLSTPPVVTPSVAVETDETNRRYNFHYQFNDSKLILYGSFEENLYEILEFFSESKRTIFLYYKGNYYYLDESKRSVTPLTAISDPTLLKKLKAYREK